MYVTHSLAKMYCVGPNSNYKFNYFIHSFFHFFFFTFFLTITTTFQSKLNLVKFILHLITVITVSSQTTAGHSCAVCSPATEVKVVAVLAVEQVCICQHDAGALLGQVLDDLHDCYTFFFHRNLQRKWSDTI